MWAWRSALAPTSPLSPPAWCSSAMTPARCCRSLSYPARAIARCGRTWPGPRGYNLVAVPLAAGVLAFAGVVLPPAAAAVLMSASTVVVALNAQLLRRLNLDPARLAGH